MKVEIFQASGLEEIKLLDRRINKWLANGAEVKHISTAMCQMGDATIGERYQHFVVTVWYEDIKPSN